MNIKEAVAARISESSEIVASEAINIIASEIIDKRVKLVVSIMTELDNLDKDFRRLKPDVLSFDESGKEISKYFGRDTKEKRQKIVDRREKIDKALAKALDQNEFDDLFKLSGDKKEKEQNESQQPSVAN